MVISPFVIRFVVFIYLVLTYLLPKMNFIHSYNYSFTVIYVYFTAFYYIEIFVIVSNVTQCTINEDLITA